MLSLQQVLWASAHYFNKIWQYRWCQTINFFQCKLKAQPIRQWISHHQIISYASITQVTLWSYPVPIFHIFLPHIFKLGLPVSLSSRLLTCSKYIHKQNILTFTSPVINSWEAGYPWISIASQSMSEQQLKCYLLKYNPFTQTLANERLLDLWSFCKILQSDHRTLEIYQTSILQLRSLFPVSLYVYSNSAYVPP